MVDLNKELTAAELVELANKPVILKTKNPVRGTYERIRNGDLIRKFSDAYGVFDDMTGYAVEKIEGDTYYLANV